MNLQLTQVDSFTDRPFRGNPAAVCITEAPLPDELMQNIALEMNLSETAFLVAQPDGYDLRWFTPQIEIDLCGHATLASAHVLWEKGLLAPDRPARFHTKSGLLTALRKEGRIELDFPADPVSPTEPLPVILKALEVQPVSFCVSRWDYLVEVEREAMVRELKPDFGLLAQVEGRGILVTSRAEADDYDFVSRFFAPAAGINEDPVTGSAHCTLACFWAPKLGKQQFKAYQASARGGTVWVELCGERVRLRGNAVTVLQCDLVAAE